MKTIREYFEELNKLEETTFRPSLIGKHYNKHVAKDLKQYLLDETDELFDPISEEEYDYDGDTLSKMTVNTSEYDSEDDVIGFVGLNNFNEENVYKFRKSESDLVIYRADKDAAYTITYFKASGDGRSRYERLKNKHYLRELNPEDDFYNR